MAGEMLNLAYKNPAKSPKLHAFLQGSDDLARLITVRSFGFTGFTSIRRRYFGAL